MWVKWDTGKENITAGARLKKNKILSLKGRGKVKMDVNDVVKLGCQVVRKTIKFKPADGNPREIVLRDSWTQNSRTLSGTD